MWVFTEEELRNAAGEFRVAPGSPLAFATSLRVHVGREGAWIAQHFATWVAGMPRLRRIEPSGAPRAMRPLLRRLGAAPGLREVEMGGRLNYVDIQCLAAGLADLPGLRALRLDGTEIDADGIQLLLERPLPLRRLEIHNGWLDAAAMRALADGMPRLPGLEELCLREHRKLDGPGLAAACGAAPRLRRLEVPITGTDAHTLLAVAEAAPWIRELDWSDNGMSRLDNMCTPWYEARSQTGHARANRDASVALRRALGLLELEELRLANCAPAWTRVRDVLCSPLHAPSVRRLHLKGVALAGLGAPQPERLPGDEEPPIGLPGWRNPFAFLEAMAGLRALCLAEVPVQLGELFGSVGGLPLEELRLREVNLGADEVPELMRRAAGLPLLRHLEVSWNRLGRRGGAAVRAGLAALPQLEVLNVTDENIPRATVRAILREAVRRCAVRSIRAIQYPERDGAEGGLRAYVEELRATRPWIDLQADEFAMPEERARPGRAYRVWRGRSRRLPPELLEPFVVAAYGVPPARLRAWAAADRPAKRRR